MTTATKIECAICDATAPSVEAAIAWGWSASYYIGDDDTGNPICDECAACCCRIADDGELELIEEVR